MLTKEAFVWFGVGFFSGCSRLGKVVSKNVSEFTTHEDSLGIRLV